MSGVRAGLLWLCGALLLSVACDSKEELRPTSEPLLASLATTTTQADPVHGDDDCRAIGPHSNRVPLGATALSQEDRARLTALRVSAHVGSTTLRKRDSQWFVSGGNACQVPTSRISRALDSLVALRATPTEERPTSGRAFTLQVVALVDEERVLHLDVADRSADGDLIQVPNYSTFRVQGLDRDLWTPQADAWCLDRHDR